jgi:hypothetical protein
LLLYSSKPSLGVFQLAGHFTSSTNANKLSGTIITTPSTSFLTPLPGIEEEEAPTSTTLSHVNLAPAATSFLAPLPGKSGRLLRGEFPHAHPLLCYLFCFTLLYFTCIIFYQKTQKK